MQNFLQTWYVKLSLFEFSFSDPRRRDNRRMDRQDLSKHASRTHNNKRGVRQEDAYSEIQFPRHRHLESVDRSG